MRLRVRVGERQGRIQVHVKIDLHVVGSAARPDLVHAEYAGNAHGDVANAGRIERSLIDEHAEILPEDLPCGLADEQTHDGSRQKIRPRKPQRYRAKRPEHHRGSKPVRKSMTRIRSEKTALQLPAAAPLVRAHHEVDGYRR